MRRTAILIPVIAALLAVPAVAGPPVSSVGSGGLQVTAKTHTPPPVRPAALTPAQYNALRLMQVMPEHSVALNTSATYSAREKQLKLTRFSDDALTVIYDVGWPGLYLALLICAAPL